MKKMLFLTAILFILSCTDQNSRQKRLDLYINYISDNYFYIQTLAIPVKDTTGYVLTSSMELNNLYESLYFDDFPSFSTFLKASFNNRIIDFDSFTRVNYTYFEIDKGLFNEYSSLDKSQLMVSVLVEKDESKFEIKSTFSEKEKYTIVKLLNDVSLVVLIDHHTNEFGIIDYLDFKADTFPAGLSLQ